MRQVCVGLLDAAWGLATCRIVASDRDGVWFRFIRFALLHAVVFCWVSRCFGSWVLLGFFCLLRVTHKSEQANPNVDQRMHTHSRKSMEPRQPVVATQTHMLVNYLHLHLHAPQLQHRHSSDLCPPTKPHRDINTSTAKPHHNAPPAHAR